RANPQVARTKPCPGPRRRGGGGGGGGVGVPGWYVVVAVGVSCAAAHGPPVSAGAPCPVVAVRSPAHPAPYASVTASSCSDGGSWGAGAAVPASGAAASGGPAAAVCPVCGPWTGAAVPGGEPPECGGGPPSGGGGDGPGDGVRAGAGGGGAAA